LNQDQKKKDLFIVDNSDSDWKVRDYLKDWTELATQFDIATGYFEIGALLALDAHWQKLDKIRILMGDEVSKRTKQAFLKSLEEIKKKLDDSIEIEKETNDFLHGVPAIVEALKSKKIDCRVYRKDKFHAKAYITHGKHPVVGSSGLVGSSNLTVPGITENVELNVQIKAEVEQLQEWYERHWKEAEEVTPEILKVVERHTREYSPFEVYVRALLDYFAGKEKQEDEWESNESVIYKMLSEYQQKGYHRALQIAEEWDGALICDGVGLGKTFIGLMILERCIRDKKRVLLIVPKSSKESVWMANINRFLKKKYHIFLNEMFHIRLHTDLGREGGIPEDVLDYYKQYKDVIIIDEAHHFRNPHANRGMLLMDLAKGKKLYYLTATPINNSLDDLYYLINYFTQGNQKHFEKKGIQNLRKHFIDNEKRLENSYQQQTIVDAVDNEDFLRTDDLLKNVLIQRSRKYVMESESQSSSMPLFPERQIPRVIKYSLKDVYSTIYGEIKEAFDKDTPFLSLAIYNTEAYDKNPDKQLLQTQKQVIGLIRTLFLKRLESSFKAFEASVEDLLSKMAKFLKTYDSVRFEAWENTNRRWWSIAQKHIVDRLEKEESEEEDELPEEILGFEPSNTDMKKLISDLIADMELLTAFLSKIYRRFYLKDFEGRHEDPEKDDKLQQLINVLKNEPLIKGQKVLIFSEFRDTARYLHRQLKVAGIKNMEQIDSGRNIENREEIIKRFAPFYNCFSNQSELEQFTKNQINILISTDVLSEGLNLQDASLIINYDLHWNPVRLMQRIGRVDRRLDPTIETALKRPKKLDGKIYFWNFLPPDELEEILHLKQRLDGKILRINKILGIEGPLLGPDDPQMALKLFNERYEGKETIEELMNLEREHIEKEYPDLVKEILNYPLRLFSGKLAGEGFEQIKNRKQEIRKDLAANKTPGIFFCFLIPSVEEQSKTDLFDESGSSIWQGEIRWYFYNTATEEISEDLKPIWTGIRCIEATPRHCILEHSTLSEIRKKIEKHIKNTYLKSVQAPQGVKPILKAWMELS